MLLKGIYIGSNKLENNLSVLVNVNTHQTIQPGNLIQLNRQEILLNKRTQDVYHCFTCKIRTRKRKKEREGRFEHSLNTKQCKINKFNLKYLDGRMTHSKQKGLIVAIHVSIEMIRNIPQNSIFINKSNVMCHWLTPIILAAWNLKEDHSSRPVQADNL
jgi:hypothetical protein